METTVISYLTAWPSRDIVVAGHQQVTRDWWRSWPGRFEIVASQLVVEEAAEGDPEAAAARLAALADIPLLLAAEAAPMLAQELVSTAGIPAAAARDALHVAIAATSGVDYLVTWNCRHLANAALRTRIEGVCRAAGYEPPTICTPDELMETESDGE